MKLHRSKLIIGILDTALVKTFFFTTSKKDIW
jgi:hypothetical protein